MKIFRRNVFTGSLLFLAVAGVANAEIDVVPSTDTIVERIGEARTENRARIRSFDVIRTYQLFGKECQRTKSEVTAAISYKPYGVQSYTIHKASGASLGETIVRKILENEKEVLTNPAATDLSADNYVFRFLRTDSLDGRPCYLLALRPKRKDTKLFVGTVWVDASRYLIRKVEAEFVQPASWWLHNVHLTLEFQDVHGMWLQTGFLSTADVRLLGPYTMVSRDVEYRMDEIEATVRPASP